MSIATEITALNTNLTAAKTAVTTKGGTVGDTGLAGLASEIATIPSGGGGSTPSEWGRVWFHPFETGWILSPTLTENVTVTVVNEQTFSDMIEMEFFRTSTSESMEYNPNDDLWSCGGSISAWQGSPQDLEDQWGIQATIDDPNSAASFYFSYVPDYLDGLVIDSQHTASIELSEDMFTNLLFDGSYMCISDFFNIKIPAETITKFEVGTETITIPDGFLAGCVYLTNLDLSHANSLTTIGVSFLQNCCRFNQSISLPPTVTSIGPLFMWGCDQMVSTVNVGSIPATAIASSNNTFSVVNSSSPAYSTGITIAGATASDWIAKFPNRTSSPYRKLILGNA